MESRILILSNDTAYEEHLRYRLEEAGCEAHSSHSLSELKEVLQHPWALIIADSRFGGLEPEKLLEQLDAGKNAVFFYTESSDYGQAKALQGMGVLEVFSKWRRGELLKAILARVNPQPQDTTVKDAASPSGRAIKCLLVDDSPTIRRFVKKIIEQGFPGSEVYEAEDGKTAIHELASQKMDVIVTDMQMPGVDGLSFIKTLHRNPLLSKKPIVILSGAVTPEMQAELGSVPTLRILSKPAEPNVLIETIRSLLKAGTAITKGS